MTSVKCLHYIGGESNRYTRLADVQKTCRYADISGGGLSPGGGSVASKLCINHLKKANDRFLHLD